MKNGNLDATKKPSVFIVGLDGATFDLIQPWVEEGALPTFSKIMQEGTWGRLQSVVPPLTGTAWNSFATGKNPGKHGIFDFIHRGTDEYYGVPINASMRDGESLWHLLSEAGKRVGVLSVPATYPPEPVNGFLVTGMLTPPGVDNFTYPLSLGKEIQASVPSFTTSPDGVAHPLGRELGLLDALDDMTEMDMETTRYLLDRFDLDFFMTVFKETDVAMHWLWRFMDKDHAWFQSEAPKRLRDGLKHCYQRMDKCLAEIIEIAGENTIIIIMSDHGAGPLEQYIHVNSWLLKEGFMQLNKNASTQAKRLLYQMGISPAALYKLSMAMGRGRQVAGTLRQHKKGVLALMRSVFLSYSDVNWAQTQVYSLGNYGQLYVNLSGREPQGIVNPGDEYDQVIEDLVDRLNNLRNPRTGELIAVDIYHREDIYQGDHMTEGPDIVFLPKDMRYNGFGLYQFSSRSWLEPSFDRSGGHRMDGILMATGPGISRNTQLEDAALIDIAPTVLAAMDVPIPDDMDGKVLTDVFEEGYFTQHPIRYTKGSEQGIQAKVELSPEQEEEIKERLRGLGYLA